MDNQNSEQKNNLKLILAIIIPIILAISIVFGYMVVAEKNISDVKKVFEKEEEYSMLLEEFLVNIKSPAGKNRYLKIKLALMYTEKSHGEILNSNVNKIRDIIVADLREKHTEEILDTEKTDEIKSHIMEDINTSLNENLVKDIYITDMIVQ